MLVGYERVSTLDQNPTLQIDALQAAGCERIFTQERPVGGHAASAHGNWSSPKRCSLIRPSPSRRLRRISRCRPRRCTAIFQEGGAACPRTEPWTSHRFTSIH